MNISKVKRRRVVDTLAAIALFPIFYVLALLLDREDRKAGGAR